MVHVTAQIKLYSSNFGGKVRTVPIGTGYIPLFDFIENMKATGLITLIDKEEIKPGEEGIVKISFAHRASLGDIKQGTRFMFGEGRSHVGEGYIINIDSWE